MYPLGRLALVVARAQLRPRRPVLAPSRLDLRVWPQDVDPNLHLNNGRAFTLMDLGRFDLLLGGGLLGAALRRGMRPLVRAQAVTFHAPLRLLEPFTLESRVEAWDERWFYIAHSLTRSDGRVAVRAHLQGALRARGGPATRPAELVAATGQDPESPPLSPALAAWVEAMTGLAERG